MAQLTGLGVKRLRSLFEVYPPLEIRPITILLGKNSVGKSTFARILPLLRQSSERRKRSPILWFGDLVDFGSLRQSVTRGEKDLEIIFAIKFADKEIERRIRQNSENKLLYFKNSVTNPIKIRDAEVSITLANDDETDAAYASKLQLKFHDAIVELNISSKNNEIQSVIVDAHEYKVPAPAFRVVANQGSVAPKLLFIRQDTENKDRWLVGRNPWRSALIRTIARYLHSNTASSTIFRIAGQLVVGSRKDLLTSMLEIDGPQGWINLRSSLNETHSFVRQVQRDLIAANIESIVEVLDEGLSEISEGVRYLKPLRATAERYYRRLDLSVSEIDPEGRNFPMFLDSLSAIELQNFQDWSKQYLDLDVAPLKEGAQLMVMAKVSRDTAMSNVADMGFGISQVLPIAAQLWASKNLFEFGGHPSSFIVIEQPELHLHPEYQARLGDVFSGFIKSDSSIYGRHRREIHPRLVIETHSQHLVNRLGALIEKGHLDPKDVSIILFEQDPNWVFRTNVTGHSGPS